MGEVVEVRATHHVAQGRVAAAIALAWAVIGAGGVEACQLFATIDDRPRALFDAGAVRIDSSPDALPGAGDARTDVVDPFCATVTCASPTVCSRGLCCTAADPNKLVTGTIPWGLEWTLARPSSALEALFRVDVIYVGAIMNTNVVNVVGTIDDQQFELGLVSDIPDDDDVWSGPSAILTLFGTDDLNLVEAKPRTRKGHSSVHHEVSLQYSVPWGAGTHRMRVERTSSTPDGGAGTADEFNVILGIDSDVPVAIGSFWVKRRGASPASIATNVTQHATLYNSRKLARAPVSVPYSSIAPFAFAMTVSGDDIAATRATSRYYAEDERGFLNSDLSYDPTSQTVVGVLGEGTLRCHPAGALFSR